MAGPEPRPGASPPEPPVLAWVADRCLRVSFPGPTAAARAAAVAAAARALGDAGPPGLVDLTPAYASLLLTFDPERLEPAEAERAVRARLGGPAGPPGAPGPLHELPTCYDGPCAPDLEEVARLLGLPRDEVVARHGAPEYVVAFLGFSPGFPYLLGLSPSLATPRLARPRARVPAGSVAVAGGQAGVYPRETPGGWRLIGRTPLPLFDPGRSPPALLAPGDRVRFTRIAHAAHPEAGQGLAP